MTIKDMEEKTGMSRTSIRFYESEGLITPERRENGYRNYSEEDARVLRKVKLLRMMDISLEEVKALCGGEAQLSAALERLEQTMDQRRLHLERTREAAQQMIREEVDFAELDPERYLPLMEEGAAWKEDVQPRLNLPWRRYWARGLDWVLYNSLVSLALRGFQHRIVFVPILTVFAMLLLEPLLLHLFGTTFGKAVFGIRVTDPEGNRLDLSTGLERTWMVLWEGEALRLPLISWYFLYKNLSLAEQESPLSWESDSELTYTDGKNWRYMLFLAVWAALIGLEYYVVGG